MRLKSDATDLIRAFLFYKIMAEQKKGFILYADQKALFEQLPNEKAGELIKFIFSYVNDENPITEDIIINLAFTPIKQQLKRDLVKFLEIKEKRSEAGKIGMAKRWQSITNDNKALQAITNITVNDNVNVNDNVINTKADVISTDQWGNEIDVNGFHIKTKKK
jgi:hypothetical protein